MTLALYKSAKTVSVTVAFLAIFTAGFLAVSLRPGGAVAAATNSPSASVLGVYRGAGTPSSVAAYAQWLGRPIAYASDFEATDSWTSVSSPDWWLSQWKGSGYTLVLGVPMVPATSYLSDSDVSSFLQQGAAGNFNSYFQTLAQKLVSYGFGNAILRLGWEMNGGWYNWRAAPNPTAWIGYWRQIVTTMRAVAPNLRFDWNVSLGYQQVPPDQIYPGDSYVDMIGVDAYDEAWGPNGSVVSDPVTRWANYIGGGTYGLSWYAAFANQHGKPLTIPEWGETTRSDGHGGGDDSYYATQMAAFVADPANNVAFESYFEVDASDGAHRLMTGEFPNSATAYLAAFGASSATTQSTTTTTTQATTPPPTTTTTQTATTPPPTTTTTQTTTPPPTTTTTHTATTPPPTTTTTQTTTPPPTTTTTATTVFSPLQQLGHGHFGHGGRR